MTPSASAGSTCVCRTSREKQIKAITFAFISGARKAQTPLGLTVYPEHVNNSYCNQNPLLLGGLLACLVGWFLTSFLSASTRAVAPKNSLASLNCT